MKNKLVVKCETQWIDRHIVVPKDDDEGLCSDLSSDYLGHSVLVIGKKNLTKSKKKSILKAVNKFLCD